MYSASSVILAPLYLIQVPLDSDVVIITTQENIYFLLIYSYAESLTIVPFIRARAHDHMFLLYIHY